MNLNSTFIITPSVNLLDIVKKKKKKVNFRNFKIINCFKFFLQVEPILQVDMGTWVSQNNF